MVEGRIVVGSAVNLLKQLADKSVGAIITDPPFHISTQRAASWAQTRGMGNDPWTDVADIDGVIEWTKPHVVEAARVIRPGGALVVMGGTQSLIGWDMAALKLGFRWMAELVILWNTGKPRMGSFGSLYTRIAWYSRMGLRHTFNAEQQSIYSNVLVCDKIVMSDRHHPSEKPVGLTNFLISLLSRSDDLIVDPFCGSGSTLVSAEQTGRRWIGADTDKTAVRIANRRVRNAESEWPEPVWLWINNRLEEV